MTSRERVRAIIDGKPTDGSAFWTGRPHQETWPRYHQYFGTKCPEDVYRTLADDVRWHNVPAHPHADAESVQRVSGRRAPEGYFRDCETPHDVDRWPWPNPDEVDFSETLNALENAEDLYRISGNLSMFFHDDCFTGFGRMQEYFIRMYTRPKVVHAITRRANDYYLQLNRRFFETAKGLFEGFKVSHDLGTQLGLLISPDMLEEFVFPYLKEQIDLGHEYGFQVILHCCGAISSIIPRLIELGVDALHPIQARAKGMSAEELSRFSGQVGFIGGIDTQDLLVNGTPEEVRRETERVIDILGPLVVSPSHEALLPNVPPENVVAISEAVNERRGERKTR